MNPVQTIIVRRTDTLAAIRNALHQALPGKVLIVMPPDGQALLSEPVDLALLKQEAASLGIEIGIVAFDRRVRIAGRAVNVPVYIFERWGRWRMAQDAPWWWTPRPQRSGAPTRLKPADRRAMHARMRPFPRWLRFIERYLTIVIFFTVLAVVGVTALYTLPSATIRLQPELRPVNISRVVVADPRYDEAAQAGGSTVSGRRLVTVERRRADVVPTGFRAVPQTAARGTVTFVNRLSEPVVIPAGTRVTTAGNTRIAFQTVAEAITPDRLGGQVDVEVVAVLPGLNGNLPADQINRIEGALGAVLNVRNLWPTSGGTVEYLPAVTSADRARLRDHVIEMLIAAARSSMEVEITPGEFLAGDSVRVVAIYLETFSHFVGEEAPLLTLEMRAELHGTAVNENATEALIYRELRDSVPENFRLMEETITTRIGAVLGVDTEGRISLEMVSDAIMVANLSTAPVIDEIAGQQIPVARAWLNDRLPLRAPPEVRVWPSALERMPYLTARIYTVVDTGP